MTLERRALFVACLVAPLCVLLACGVDGKTPDCTNPTAGCEPSVPNPNPDARADAPGDGAQVDAARDSGTTGDATDGGSDVRTDATGDAASDAKLDADAKG